MQYPAREIKHLDFILLKGAIKCESHAFVHRRDDMDEAVFVNIVEFTKKPQGMIFWLPLEARVKGLESLDRPNGFRINPVEVRANLGVELEFGPEYRKLVLAEPRGTTG